jgi:hypothetical protein
MPNPQTFRTKSNIKPIYSHQDDSYAAKLRSQTYDGMNSNLDMYSAQDYAEDFLYAISGLEKEQE